jgi:hypothetical protein
MVVASAFYPLTLHGAESANARIWCLSLRFQEGTDSFGDTLDLSSIGGTPNGELLPYNGLTYVSAFSLDDSNLSGVMVNGTIFINLPPVVDVNGNGFNDFFETALAVAATTTGSYTTVLGNGTVTANWSRGAGSKDGTCGLHLVDNAFGDLGYFTHNFELIEYSGPLLFTPSSNTVSGSVNLVKTGDSTSQLQGPVQFVKVSTNRFNRLILQPGGWTNATAQVLTYTNGLFQRDLPWTTNYYGFVQFDDGDPSTAAPDYLNWVLSIDDTNDANHNGIPDFSDDPQGVTPPHAPNLSVTLSSTNVLISITGDIGHTHDIQQSFLLPATNWQTVASVTLTKSPQTVPIPSPPGPAAFWRAVAH